jgi:hypothetical protein
MHVLQFSFPNHFNHAFALVAKHFDSVYNHLSMTIDINNHEHSLEILQDVWHCEICNRKPGRGFGMLCYFVLVCLVMVCIFTISKVSA